MPPRTPKPAYLAAEFILLFLAMPTLFAWLGPNATVAVIPALWAFSVYAWFVQDRGSPLINWQDEVAALHKFGPGIMLRLAGGCAILLGLIAWFSPSSLFDTPRANPKLWLIVIALYPLLSVIPQEYLYRRYFFARYGSRLGLAITIILSSVLFGLAHTVFGNWQAVALTISGGLIFSVTYHRSQSLLCACVEHALWGDLIFTIGLGEFFVGGSVKALFNL